MKVSKKTERLPPILATPEMKEDVRDFCHEYRIYSFSSFALDAIQKEMTRMRKTFPAMPDV